LGGVLSRSLDRMIIVFGIPAGDPPPNNGLQLTAYRFFHLTLVESG